MTFVISQEATRSSLVFNDDSILEIQPLHDYAVEALEAFGLAPTTRPEMRFDSVVITAGAIELSIEITDGDNLEESARIRVAVTKLRDSETLHPQAETVILAEVLSLMIERTGGDTVHWAPADVSIAASRFQAAFKPMRLRAPDEMPVIKPRRVRPGWAKAEPMTQAALIRSMPKNQPLGIRDGKEDLTAVFRTVADQDARTAPETDAPEPAAEAKDDTVIDFNPRRAATLAATATVSILNPMIGIPLAGYQALRGADIKVAGHAVVLAAIFSGLSGALLPHMAMF